MIALDRPAAPTSRTSRRFAVRPSTSTSSPHHTNTSIPISRAGRRRNLPPPSTPTRRSVSSMKGLMPLALSPSWSTNSSSSLADDRVDGNVDGYFPEVLARDLERSSSVFTALRMTSGPPAANLSADYKDDNPAWPYRSSSQLYQGASGPVHSLVPIQERNSVVDFMSPPNESKFDDTTTDEDSVSGTEISRGGGVASPTRRQRSIGTAPTSLASSSGGPSPKSSPHCSLQRTYSWIDADSDDEEQDLQVEQSEDNLATLSPRPPTPPESETSVGSKTDRQEPPRTSVYKKNLHRKSYSVGTATPVSPPGRRRSVRRPDSVSQQPPVTLNSPPPSSGRSTVSPPSPAHRPRASSMQTSRSYTHRPVVSHSRGGSQGSKSVAASFSTEPTYMGDIDTATEDEPAPNSRSASRNPVFIRPSPPPSPLPSVESWLNGNTLQYTSQCTGDELTKAIPLPPNVVETLRVSVTCFPETMLLSSSLTVETIRNYSKKVRQPSPELMTNPTPDNLVGTPRKSLWKRVVSYKRDSAESDRRRSQVPAPGTKPTEQSAVDSPKAWAPLRNVFGSSSDYILDALWAHIVAYNYISALVPRSQPRRTSGRDRPPPTGNDKEEIPKKAATLLGLSSSPDAPHGTERATKKSPASLPWSPSREGMVAEPSSRTTSYDNTTRDIQAGLMRCIMRLIATAKLMSENGNTSQDRVVEMETRDVEILFTRSLCEIVRMAEESS